VGKAGGPSLNGLGKTIAMKTHHKYLGGRHFDWGRISELKSKNDGTIDVIMFWRNPVARSISHFSFAQKLPWTADYPTFRKETLHEFMHDPETMLPIRDVWQDDMASMAWLTGTYYANWVTPNLSEEQVRERELKQMNYAAMMHLSADRLEETKWFGILEDTPRSLELLQHVFNPDGTSDINHAKRGK
jgi:hypothetical protein